MDAELKLWIQVKLAVKELKTSEFYSSLLRGLQDGPRLKSEIRSRLESEEQVQMVIYGLGSLSDSRRSRFQLALALLLRQDVPTLKIGEIQTYDPKLTRADASVIHMLGCTVLKVNEYGRRTIEKPTVFFTPFVDSWLMDNLLEANWCSCRLNKIVWLACSFRDICRNAYPWGRQREIIARMLAIENYVMEFKISSVDSWEPFRDFRWHVFKISPEVEFDSLLPSNTPSVLKEKVEKWYGNG